MKTPRIICPVGVFLMALALCALVNTIQSTEAAPRVAASLAAEQPVTPSNVDAIEAFVLNPAKTENAVKV